MATKYLGLINDADGSYRSAYVAMGLDSVTFEQNKKLILTANTPTGGITRLTERHLTTAYCRPWDATYDRFGVLREAHGWHELDYNSGQDHSAFEIKTNAGSDPAEMRTRLSIGSGADRTLAGLNYLTYLELNQGEPVVSTPFGLRLRGHLQDGSANGVVAQFLAQQDASDNVKAFLDVNPVTAGANKSVTLAVFRNTNTTVAAGPQIAIKRGDNTDVNAFLLSPKLGTMVITPTGAVGSSTSTGGAINIDNSASTGCGLVLYTNQDATASGPLASFRSDNAAFDQRALSVDYTGATHGVFIYHKGTGSSSIGLNVTGENPDDTCVGISGRESGRGTVKITHYKPAGVADTNASAISILLDAVTGGEVTAAAGIFMDSTMANPSSKLANWRSNGADVLVLTPALLTLTASARFNGNIGFYNTAATAKQTVTGSRGANAALASLLTALATVGLVTDSTSA